MQPFQAAVPQEQQLCLAAFQLRYVVHLAERPCLMYVRILDCAAAFARATKCAVCL